MTMQYGDVEAALIRVLKVPKDQHGAFRARIRYLRNLGIPDLPKVGSGSRIQFERVHTAQLLFGLEMAALGVPPRWLGNLSKSAVQAPGLLEGLESDDFFLILTSGGEGTVGAYGIITKGRPGLISFVSSQSLKKFTVLNLSQMIRELDGA